MASRARKIMDLALLKGSRYEYEVLEENSAVQISALDRPKNNCNGDQINTDAEDSMSGPSVSDAEGENLQNGVLLYDCHLEPSTMNTNNVTFDIIPDAISEFQISSKLLAPGILEAAGPTDNVCVSERVISFPLEIPSTLPITVLPSGLPSGNKEVKSSDSFQKSDISNSSNDYEPSSKKLNTDKEHTIEINSEVPLYRVQKTETFMPTCLSLVPYSDSESDAENKEVENSRKRKKNVHKWKKSIRKRKCLSGQEYVSACGKNVAKKEIKPPCKPNCRLKCSTKLSDDERKNIFDNFWHESRTWDLKRQFVLSTVETESLQRNRPRDNTRESKRKKTNVYTFLLNNNSKIKVCKTMYLNTLSVSEQFVTTAQLLGGSAGLVKTDQRGKHSPANKTDPSMIYDIKKHIDKYPAYASHYSRERTQKKYLGSHLNLSIMYKNYVEECKAEAKPVCKEWLFRKVFNEEFNLSFKQPDVDTCDSCDAFESQLKSMHLTEEERIVIQGRKGQHLEEASKRYKLKLQDKEQCKNNANSKVVMVDLQKCLPTPYLTNSQSFYLRKLWTLNYTIHDPVSKSSHCMMYDESVGARGGNEMASCFLRWAVEELVQSDVETLTVWSDNCSSQNRNQFMIMMYFWLLKVAPNLVEINHKFLLPGHTHMEVDAIHSLIERKRKKLKTQDIVTCNDWARLVSESGQNIRVLRMELEHFRNFGILSGSSNSPFIIRKITTTGEQVSVSQMVHLQVKKEFMGHLFFKTSFDEEKFQEVDMRRNRRLQLVIPDHLPLMRQTKKPISKAKYDDIQKLLTWIPEEYREYFRSLPFEDNVQEYPD